MKNIEIEIRVQVENIDELKCWLTESAEEINQESQMDTYYSSANKGFLYSDSTGKMQADKWLRVRKSEYGDSICYKLVHRDDSGSFVFADEYETKVENSKVISAILSALEYEELCVVSKTRTSWRYNNYIICIDSVDSLGDFVEVELLSVNNICDIKSIKHEMIKFIEKISRSNVSKVEGGYPWLLWNKAVAV